MQELSGHLAAEITRLCSLAKQDELPLSQGMDVYEMEVSVVSGALNISTLDMLSLKTLEHKFGFKCFSFILVQQFIAWDSRLPLVFTVSNCRYGCNRN